MLTVASVNEGVSGLGDALVTLATTKEPRIPMQAATKAALANLCATGLAPKERNFDLPANSLRASL